MIYNKKIKSTFIVSLSLTKNAFFLALVSICFFSCEPGKTTPSTDCFPAGNLQKLGICIGDQVIKCPSGMPDCFEEFGEFESKAWKKLKTDMGSGFDPEFKIKDPMITGVFVPGGGSGDIRRPACSLPPLPPGTTFHDQKPEVLYASIETITSSTNNYKLEDTNLVYYNYSADENIFNQDPNAERINGITLTLFENNNLAKGDTAFLKIRNHYQSLLTQIPAGNSLANLSGDWAKLKTIDNTLKSPRAFKASHGSLTSYIIELNRTTILRMRFWNDPSELSGIDWKKHVQFYP